MPFNSDPNMHIPNHEINTQQVVQNDQPYKQEPKTFFEAVSEIQQLSVVEQKAREQVDKGYFTLSQRYNYFMIGLKTGVIESLVLMLMFPLLIHIVPASLAYFSSIKISRTALYAMDMVSYSFLSVITIIFLALIRFYVGPLSRASISWLFYGRTFSLMIKAVITYYVYYWIFTASYTKPSWILIGSDWMAFIVNGVTNGLWIIGALEKQAQTINGLQFYYFYYQLIAPILMDMSKTVVMSFVVAGALPLIAIILKKVFTLNKIDAENKKFEEY